MIHPLETLGLFLLGLGVGVAVGYGAWDVSLGSYLRLRSPTNPVLTEPPTASAPSALTEPPWRPMSSAPRDGTVVELRCTYGVRPWYGLFRWTDMIEPLTPDGDVVPMHLSSPGWYDVRHQGQGVVNEATLMWRPYAGEPGAYVDPTQGAQETAAYWREGLRAPRLRP